MTVEVVRFCSRYPNAQGAHVGVFGLVNVLGRHGMLTPDEERFRRDNNAWFDAAYPDPCQTHPDTYAHPRAAAWFKPSSADLITRTAQYLAILDHHHIAWQKLQTTDPGHVVYEDPFQVVAVPREAVAQRDMSA